MPSTLSTMRTMWIVVHTLVLLLLVVPGGAAQSARRTAPPPQEEDLVLEGEMETYVAVGGESTGWRLRTRTEQGRRRYIEVLLTPELARGVRAHTRVRVRGTMQTRRYPERGEVQVLVAKDIIEIARR